MSVSDFSDCFNAVEKLTHNLTSRNVELRARAAESLLLKLELDILPVELLHRDYHNIIGQVLLSLNLSLDTPSPATTNNLIKILRFFGRDETGRSLLRKYGAVEFMAEFRDFHKKAGNETAVDEVDALLFSFVNKNASFGVTGRLHATAGAPLHPSDTSRQIAPTANHPADSTLRHPKDPFAPFSGGIVSANSLVANLSKESGLDQLICGSNRLHLAEEDRSFLVELSTFLRFSKQEEFAVDSFVFRNLCKTLDNFPMAAFTGSFSECFLDILKVLAACKSPVLFATLYCRLLDWIANEFEAQRQFWKRDRNHAAKPETHRHRLLTVDGFLQESYPPLERTSTSSDEDKHPASKLTITSMVEAVFRAYVCCLRHSACVGLVTEKMRQTLGKMLEIAEKMNFLPSVHSVLCATVEFWETWLAAHGSFRDLNLAAFPFAISYTETIVWIAKKIGKDTICYAEAKSTHVRLMKTLNPEKFSQMFVYGLLGEQRVSQVAGFLERTDSFQALRFRTLVELSASREVLATRFSAREIDWPGLLETKEGCLQTLKDAKRVLALFEVTEHDPSAFLELYLLLSFKLREAQRAGRILDPAYQTTIKSYIAEFEGLLPKLVALQPDSKNTCTLFKCMESILRDKPKKFAGGRSPFELETELKAVLKQGSILPQLLVAALESSVTDAPPAPLLPLAMDILTSLLSQETRLPSSLDLFFMAQFLVQAAARHLQGRPLLNFMTAKFPELDKAVHLSLVFSKDHLASFQSFNSLVFDVRADSDLTLATTKKIALLGTGVDLQINKRHHYFGLVDPRNACVTFRSSVRILADLKSDCAFVDSNRLQEVHDILELFLNQKLEQKIRLEALNQCLEAMLSLRKNPEAAGYSALLARLASEKLLNEKPGVFTDAFVRILFSFFCYQKYNSQLKAAIVVEWKVAATQHSFREVADLLLFVSKAEKNELRFNILALVQAIFFSAGGASRSDSEPRSAQMPIPKVGVPEEQRHIGFPETQRPKFMFFEAQTTYNFFGGKLQKLAGHLDHHGLTQDTVRTLQANQGQFFSLFERLELHFETRISELKKQCEAVRSQVDLLTVAEGYAGLAYLFQRHRTLVELRKDTKKVIAHLKFVLDSIIVKATTLSENKEPQALFGELMITAALSLPYDPKRNSLPAMLHEFATLLFKNNAQKISQAVFSLEVAGHLFRFSGDAVSSVPGFENTLESFVNAVLPQLKSAEAYHLLPLISRFGSSSLLRTQKSVLDILTKTLSCFKPSNCFQDVSIKLAIFRVFLRLVSVQRKLKGPQLFELFVRAKDACRSQICSLRFYGWLAILSTLKVSNEVQFYQEAFYRCKEFVTNCAGFEHQKVNAIVLSVLAEFVSQAKQLELSADFAFIRNLAMRTEEMGMLEASAWLRLLNHFDFSHFEDQAEFLQQERKRTVEFFLSCRVALGTVCPKDCRGWSWQDHECSPIETETVQKSVLPQWAVEEGLLSNSVLTLLSQSTDTSVPLRAKICEALKATHTAFVLFLEQLVRGCSLSQPEGCLVGAAKLVKVLGYLDWVRRTTLIGVRDSAVACTVFLSVVSIIGRLPSIDSELQAATGTVSSFLKHSEGLNKKQLASLESFLVAAILRLRSLKTDSTGEHLLSTVIAPEIIETLAKSLSEQCAYPEVSETTVRNLCYVLAFSNEAKVVFLTGSFLSANKRELNRMVLEKDSERVQTVLRIFKALFYPVSGPQSFRKTSFYLPHGTKETPNSKFDQIKESFRSIFFVLSKIFAVDWQADPHSAPATVCQVLTNWHLNPSMNRFVEKQALKGKHFVLNGVFECLKETKRINTREFLDAIAFLRSIASCEFVAQQICKVRGLSGLTTRLLGLIDAEKSGQVTPQSAKLAAPLLDLIYAFSFQRATHLKLFDSKEAFCAFFAFSEKTLHSFRAKKAESVTNAACSSLRKAKQSQPTDMSEQLEFSSEVVRTLTTFSNLLLTGPCKAFITGTDGFVDVVFDCLSYTTRPGDQLLVTQILYNMIYKDGSVVKKLQTSRVAVELGDLAADTKSRIKARNQSVLRETDGTDEALHQTLRNIAAIEEIINF